LATELEQYLDLKGIEYRGDLQLNLLTCPACKRDEWSCYINNDEESEKYTLWDCKKASCNAKGNLNQFKKLMGDRVQRAPIQRIISGGPIPSMRHVPKMEPIPNIDRAAQLLRDSPEIVDWFVENFRWDEETLFRMKVGLGDAYVHLEDKNENGQRVSGRYPCVWYPSFEDGLCSMVKYRTLPGQPRGFGNVSGRPLPLYNGDVLKTNPGYVVIVEGEKNALTLLSLGEPNVIGIPGAGLAKPEWAESLKSIPTKYVIYDTDLAGRTGMGTLIEKMGGTGWVCVDLGKFTYAEYGEDEQGVFQTDHPGKDITEWVVSGKTYEDFQTLLATAAVNNLSARDLLEMGDDSLDLKIISHEELLDRPKREFVVDGLLPEGGIAIMVGPPGGGKSTVSKQMVMSISRGQQVLGREVKQGSVLFIELDEPISWTRDTLISMGVKFGEDPIHLVEDIDKNTVFAGIRKALKRDKSIRLVVVDTMNKVLGVDDINSYSEMDPALEKFRNIVKAFPHVSVLILHHAKKMGGSLGSTAIDSNADIILNIEMDTNLAMVSNMWSSKARVCAMVPKTALKFDATTQLYRILTKEELSALKGEKKTAEVAPGIPMVVSKRAKEMNAAKALVQAERDAKQIEEVPEP
jgi:archaellum biogenesis ATPase FlaH